MATLWGVCMDTEKLIDKPCAWATAKPDGSLYWENGFFKGEDENHYFFLIGSKLRAYQKTNVLRLEFSAAYVGCV